MASANHYLALRPCIELFTVGENMAQSIGGQTLLIPRGGSTIFPTSSLEILRIGEQFELQQNQSRTVSSLLLLTSGGLVVYLLYKSYTSDEDSNRNKSSTSSESAKGQTKSKWSAQSWIRWLLFGDTPDLRGQYFGPGSIIPPQNKTEAKLRKSTPSSNIVYVSPCPNCVRGVCKIRKHHQMILRGSHNLQFMPLWERDSATTSGSSTPVRIVLRRQGTGDDFKMTPMNCKDSESADDESSGDESTPTKNSPAKQKRKSSRIPPEGREKPKLTCSMTRDDESMESIHGVSGSMVDLVKDSQRSNSTSDCSGGGGDCCGWEWDSDELGAREVRRLIREASFDSLASEFSLDVSLNDGVGGQTAAQFDSLCEEIYNLKDNCDIMSEKIDFNNISSANENSVKMKSSKSDFFREINNSKESTPDLSAGGASAGNDVGNSSPDLRNLHKIIHSAPARNKRMWTLTHNTGFSDNESTYSPIHRDSSASPIFHDNTRDSRYKIALSSNTSECGDWEWDSEGLGCDASLNTTELNQVYHHDTWLQDDVIELDLEAELLTSTFNRCRNSSNHSSSSEIDASSLYNKIRLPPSGRSSAMSTSILQESADLKSMMSLSLSRSSSTGSFSKEYSHYNSNNGSHRKHHKRSPSSDESGIEDKSTISVSDKSSVTTSMISSAATPLSPVHEVRESPKHTPTPSTVKKNTSISKCTPLTAIETTREKDRTRRKIFH